MTKLALLTVTVATAFFHPGFLAGYTVALLSLLFAFTEGVLQKFIQKFLLFFLPISLFLFLTKGLFFEGGEELFQWHFLTVKREGIESALRLTSLIAAAGGCLLLFFETTEIEMFVYTLQRVGLPPVGAYLILSSFSIIPEMVCRSKTIMEAQKARGVDIEGSLWVRLKALIPSLYPLIISSVVESDERVIALEGRGFSARCPKSHYRRVEWGRADVIATLIVVVTIIVTGFFL